LREKFLSSIEAGTLFFQNFRKTLAKPAKAVARRHFGKAKRDPESGPAGSRIQAAGIPAFAGMIE
jgi:hypothetical protein